MHPLQRTSATLSVAAACFLASAQSASALVTDPGFESYTVAPSEFTQVNDGPWTFNQFTTGVAEPYTSGIPVASDPGVEHFATFDAYEGSQYVSAYAGNGSFQQDVTLTAGEYELSVWAASPAGQINLGHHEGIDGITDLVTGQFSFLFGTDAVGPVFEPPLVLEAGWIRYSTTVEVTEAGSYAVGVDHQLVAAYFINYDMFQVTPVPEPGSLMAFSIVGLLFAQRRRKLTT